MDAGLLAVPCSAEASPSECGQPWACSSSPPLGLQTGPGLTQASSCGGKDHPPFSTAVGWPLPRGRALTFGSQGGKNSWLPLWPLRKLFIPVWLSRQTPDRASRSQGCHALFIGSGPGVVGPGCRTRCSGPRARAAAPLARLLLDRVRDAVDPQARAGPRPAPRGLAPVPGPARCAEPRSLQQRVRGRELHLELARPRATRRRRLLPASWGPPPGSPPSPRSAARAARPGPPPPRLAAAARPRRKAAGSWSGEGAAEREMSAPASSWDPYPPWACSLYVSGIPPSFHAPEGDPHSAPSPGGPASRKRLPTQADLRPRSVHRSGVPVCPLEGKRSMF